MSGEGFFSVSLQIAIDMADGMGGDAVVIDIQPHLDAMNMNRRRQLQDENERTLTGTHNSNSAMCMYKVPRSLIDISPKAIAPEKVSIGPYHRGQQDQLLDFEKYKWRSLEKLLTRTNKDLRVFVEAAQRKEEEARRCYDDTIISMSSPEFVEMMVLDGCFIIELFRPGGTSDAIFSEPAGLIPVITGDLLKLENQFPFFVLQVLFDLSLEDEEDPNLAFLALKFFHVSFPRPTEEVLDWSTEFPADQMKHLLHLFHSSSSTVVRREPLTIYEKFTREVRLGPIKFITSFGGILASLQMYVLVRTISLLWIVFLIIKRLLLPYGPHREYRPSSKSIQCTKKLRKSGFTFKPLRAESLLVIHYEDQVLQIPAITINNLTITVFVNCIALEQCSYQNTPSDFTTYIAFMSCLIKSSKDVAFLSSDGIITSSFSYNDHDVAALFNKFGEKVYFDKNDCYLSQQFKDMEAFYNSPQASFIRTYFSSPWSFISVLSACLLISLSVGQTVLSILTYIHNHKIWSASSN